MRLQNGYQKCPKCIGAGCYWCRRTGYMAQCPACMNNEPELITRSDDEFDCLACGNKFDKGGSLVAKEPKPKPDPNKPPQKAPVGYKEDEQRED